MIPAGFFPRPRHLTRLPISAIIACICLSLANTSLHGVSLCTNTRPHVCKSVEAKKKKKNFLQYRTRSEIIKQVVQVHPSICLMHRGILCSLVHTNPDSPVLLVHMLFTPRVPRLRADYNMPCFGEERLCVSHRHTHFSFYVSFKPCFLPSLNITHGLSQFVAMRLVHSVGKLTYRSGQSYPFIPERDR